MTKPVEINVLFPFNFCSTVVRFLPIALHASVLWKPHTIDVASLQTRPHVASEGFLVLTHVCSSFVVERIVSVGVGKQKQETEQNHLYVCARACMHVYVCLCVYMCMCMQMNAQTLGRGMCRRACANLDDDMMYTYESMIVDGQTSLTWCWFCACPCMYLYAVGRLPWTEDGYTHVALQIYVGMIYLVQTGHLGAFEWVSAMIMCRLIDRFVKGGSEGGSEGKCMGVFLYTSKSRSRRKGGMCAHESY